jgi:hypothetical protein
MNMINDVGPAFLVWEPNGKDQPEMTGFGMTLRDYFAAKAMQADMTDMTDGIHESDFASVAARAYKMADDMLKARAA